MMQDAAGFAHARRRNDHTRTVEAVQRLRFVYIADIFKPLKAEWIVAILSKRSGLFIPAFGLLAKTLCGIYRERTIHEYRDGGDLVRVHQLMQQQDQLLRAPDGERRHDDL